MIRWITSFSFLCASCGVQAQPEWARTAAAYEVPLPTAADKKQFLNLLRKEAGAHGYHVDAATPHELAVQSQVSPITLNASVWRGDDDDESMASAMDFEDRIGRVWITFPRGQDPQRSTGFRERLVSKLKTGWPNTASLPIMPNGAVPLTADLIRAPSGYVVNPAAAAKYSANKL